jgi:hypothetical protein
VSEPVPRIDPDDFGERDLARLFMAMTMEEARAAEQVLDMHEIAYAVVAEPVGRTLFGSARNAAVFYVAADDAARCSAVFERAGMGAGIVPDWD